MSYSRSALILATPLIKSWAQANQDFLYKLGRSIGDDVANVVEGKVSSMTSFDPPPEVVEDEEKSWLEPILTPLSKGIGDEAEPRIKAALLKPALLFSIGSGGLGFLLGRYVK